MYEELLKRQERQLNALESKLKSGNVKNAFPLQNKIKNLKSDIAKTKHFIHLSK